MLFPKGKKKTSEIMGNFFSKVLLYAKNDFQINMTLLR